MMLLLLKEIRQIILTKHYQQKSQQYGQLLLHKHVHYMIYAYTVKVS